MVVTPDKIVKIPVNGANLIVHQKIIPNTLVATKDVASWVLNGQPMKPRALLGGDGKPRGITVHNTGDITGSGLRTGAESAAEQYVLATYNGNMGGAVVTYYVSDSGHIWQTLNDNERGWHATDGSSRRMGTRGVQIGGNLDTISIEGVGDKSTDGVARLVAYLCYKYGLDPDFDVYQHNFFYSSKSCPLYIRSYGWTKFLTDVKKHYASLGGKPPVAVVEKPKTEETKPPTNDGSYRLQVGAYRVKNYADSFMVQLRAANYPVYSETRSDGMILVYVGKFSTQAAAQTAKTTLEKVGHKPILQKI